VIAGPRGQAWADAVAGLTPATVPVPIHCLVANRDFADPAGSWQRACEIEPDGALLIRPDQHVAWRAPRASRDGAADLLAAVRSVLGP